MNEWRGITRQKTSWSQFLLIYGRTTTFGGESKECYTGECLSVPYTVVAERLRPKACLLQHVVFDKDARGEKATITLLYDHIHHRRITKGCFTKK